MTEHKEQTQNATDIIEQFCFPSALSQEAHQRELQAWLKEYEWIEIPVGRWGAAKRRVFLLHQQRNDKECVLALKFVELRRRSDVAKFETEARLLQQVSATWPTKLIE